MVPRQRLRETLSACAASGALALLGLLNGACSRLPVDAESPQRTQLRDAIEARARGVFDAAVLIKPRESPSADALAAGLAPLVFCEVADGPNDRIHTAPEVVFYRADALTLRGRAFPQMSYLWRAGAGASGWRGVRITLDSRGLPVIWEVLNGDAQNQTHAARVVFVARSLEARARAAFGPPLGGKRFAVEADAEAARETIVPRALDDGPALMGPEVYVNRAGEITAVTCRCMPPQVRQLAATAWYELRPLTAGDAEAAAVLAAATDVAAVLRLPPDF